jgi:small-conductance mechanosensitive channel
MEARAMRPADLEAWLAALTQASVVVELAVLGACLAAAWLLVRWVRSAVDPAMHQTSVWFGRRVVDGVLFPVLALLLALAARAAMAAWPTHAPPIALLHLAVPVLAALVVIRVGVRVLRAAFPASRTVRVFERTLSWLIWGALALWLTGLLPKLLGELEAVRWTMGGASVSLRTLIEGGVSAAAVMVLALWVSSAIEMRLLAGATDNLSVRKMAANATRALLLLVGLLLALSAVGIPLGALSVLGGAVGVGLGFGLQKLVANYVSGFVILAERSLRIGDVVKVDNFEGRISDIKTRYTVIRALNGRESIVPNELLLTQRVESSSLADPHVAITTAVQVAYGTDLDALMPCLVEAVAAVPRVLPSPAPGVMLESFGADGLNLQIAFWIADPENGQGNVKSDVNLAILRTVEALHVRIPLPQRVVHPAAGAGEGR